MPPFQRVSSRRHPHKLRRMGRRTFLLGGTASLATLWACQPTPSADVDAGRGGSSSGPGSSSSRASSQTGSSSAAGSSQGSSSSNPDSSAGPQDAGAQEDAGASDAGAVDAGSMAAVEQLPQAALEVFPLGVASGDAAAHSAVVWTRYAGTQMLRLVVFPQSGGAPVVDVLCAPVDGGFVHVTVEGLSAGTRYQFAFITVDGGNAVRSPLGRFRAALADTSMDPVVLGATACTSNARPRFRTLEQAATRQDLDAFCLLGDTTYNDGAESLADYRAKWGENLAKEGYRALRASTSLLCTWDDHEVGNNWSPETVTPQKLATATQAFFEHQPVRRIPGAEGRLWRSSRWGRTVEVFVLDGRSERRPSTRTSPQCQYISPEQMAWLKAGLAASPAVFKVLMNSVPMGNFPQTFNLGDVLLDPEDRWQGYKAQQDELLAFIETTPVRGVVFLSGDFHLACTGRVSPDGLGSQTLEVLAGPGAQFPNPLHYLLRGPQFDFGTSTFNYVALHCDPASRQMRVAYHNEEGNLFHQQTFVLP